MEGSDNEISLGNKTPWMDIRRKTIKTSVYLQFRTENRTQYLTQTNRCAMHMPVGLTFMSSTITGQKTTHVGTRWASYIANEWRNGEERMGHPTRQSPRGNKMNIFMTKNTFFLGFRYFKLLSQIKISIIVFCKFIISVMVGLCDYSPGLQKSS
jgi:hypothetical protein